VILSTARVIVSIFGDFRDPACAGVGRFYLLGYSRSPIRSSETKARTMGDGDDLLPAAFGGAAGDPVPQLFLLALRGVVYDPEGDDNRQRHGLRVGAHPAAQSRGRDLQHAGRTDIRGHLQQNTLPCRRIRRTRAVWLPDFHPGAGVLLLPRAGSALRGNKNADFCR